MPIKKLLPVWMREVKKLWTLWVRIWTIVLPTCLLVPETSEFLAKSMAFMLTGILTVSVKETWRARSSGEGVGTTREELFALWKRIIPITALFALFFGEWYMAATIGVMFLSIPVVAREK